MDEVSPLERFDALKAPWVCVTCGARARFGQFVIDGPALRCPSCTSTNLHPIDAPEN